MAVSVNHHLDETEQAFLLSPLVTEFVVTRRWIQSDAGYIRLRAVFANGDLLEAAEYLVLSGGRIVLEDYRHHWMSKDHQLRRRWDCAPHHPEVSTHPHHCHVGVEDKIEPSTSMFITDVLNLIQDELLADDPT